MTVDRFIWRLKNSEVEFDVESILDAFWLSQQACDLSFNFERKREVETPLTDREPAKGSVAVEKERSPTLPDDKSRIAGPSGTGDTQTAVYPESSRETIARKGKASPVAIPAASPLSGRLALSRSLRPFRQRWLSRRDFDIDEQLTVEKTAELSHYMYPVFKSRLERWFDVSVIVEDEPAVAVWTDTLYFFSQMLKDTGAFQDVRLWHFRFPSIVSTDGAADSGAFLETSAGARISADVLAGGTRRLIFFATHGSSPRWSDGTYIRFLQRWTPHCSVVILHLLPKRLWKRTPLGEPNGFCYTGEPGAPTSRLSAEKFWWALSREDERNALAVPCVPISIKEMENWSRMQMGRGDRCAAFLFSDFDHVIENKQLKPESPQDFERLISVFRTEAPDAFRLATYLASGPFTLPVARLVQEARFGSAEHSQLAEVLLCGLIQAWYPKDGTNDASSITYEFHPEARKILLRSLRRDDAKSIARELEKWVSHHIEHIHNRQISFRALVPDRSGKYDLPEWAQPFAVLGTSLLGIAPVIRNAGELVDRFAANNTSKIVRAAARLSNTYPTGDFDKSGIAVDLQFALLNGDLIQETTRSTWGFAQGISEVLRQRLLVGVRILWADDHPENTLEERQQLKSLGAEVRDVKNTEQALGAVTKDSYDLVISDMARGIGQSEAGLDLLAKLRNLGHKAPFIIYTAAWADTGQPKALEAGAFGCTRSRKELIDLVLRAVTEGDEALRGRANSTNRKVKTVVGSISDLSLVLDFADKKENLRRIAWSPNLRYMATGGFDGVVQVWDLRTKNLYRSLRGHSRVVYDVCWSPDSSKLASGSGDGTIRIWDLGEGALEKVFRSNSDGVLGVAWSPNGELLAVGTNSGSVLVWNVITGAQIHGGFKHKEPVHTVSWSPMGNKLASASNDGSVRVWDLSPRPRQALKLMHGKQVYGVSYSPNGEYIASCGSGGSIRIWRKSGKLNAELVGHTGSVTDVSYSADGIYLASTSWDSTVRIWNVRERRVSRSISAPSARRFHAGITFSPHTGHAIAFTTNQASAIQVWQPVAEREAGFSPFGLTDTEGVPLTEKAVHETSEPNPRLLAVLAEIGIENEDAVALWKAGPERLSKAVIDSTSDQQTAIDRILLLIRAFADSGWCQLFLMSYGQELIAISDLIDEDKLSHRYQTASWSGIIGRAASSREAVWIPNVSVEKDYIPAVPTTLSEFAIPLCSEDRLLGVVNLEFSSAAALSHSQRFYLTALCEPLARRITAKDRVIFINNVHEDAQVTATLARGLQAEGASTWSFSEQWRVYVDYSRSARTAIENSGAMIIVISRAWLTSDLAQQSHDFELLYHSMPRIICVLIDNSSVPAELMSFPMLKLADDYASALSSMLQILQLPLTRIANQEEETTQNQEALRRLWHPPKDLSRRGPLNVCTFTINPQYLTKGAKRWAKWADVLVRLDTAPSRDFVYLVPSRFSPEQLSDPEILLAKSEYLEKKRLLSAEFVRIRLKKRLTGLMFTKVMASGTQATHVYSQEYDDFLLGHVYRANAHAIAGEVMQPTRHSIDRQAFASLPSDGGSFEQRLIGFRLSSVASLESALTQVAGSSTAEVWRTSAFSSVEGVNLFDTVIADRVVARISIECPRERNRPARIALLGTRFENLRVAGQLVHVTLETGIFQHGRLTNLARVDRVRPDDFWDRDETRDEKIERYSLIRGIHSDKTLQSDDNVLDLPGLGKVVLSELTVLDDVYKVVMIRFVGFDGTSLTSVTCEASIGASPTEVRLAADGNTKSFGRLRTKSRK
jgi:CheY-like chemotaxis protein/putative methionine-R-sulfoxide reductase with GAF domain